MAQNPIHPGELLGDELQDSGMSARQLAKAIRVPPNRLYQILARKRSLTADTALRLSHYFGMSPDYWMHLQSAYELDVARSQHGSEIDQLPKRVEEPLAQGQGA